MSVTFWSGLPSLSFFDRSFLLPKNIFESDSVCIQVRPKQNLKSYPTAKGYGINPRERTSGHLKILTSPFALFSHDDTNDTFRGGVAKNRWTAMTEAPVNMNTAYRGKRKAIKMIFLHDKSFPSFLGAL